MNALQELDISGNPLSCSCLLHPFLKWSLYLFLFDPSSFPCPLPLPTHCDLSIDGAANLTTIVSTKVIPEVTTSSGQNNNNNNRRSFAVCFTALATQLSSGKGTKRDSTRLEWSPSRMVSIRNWFFFWKMELSLLKEGINSTIRVNGNLFSRGDSMSTCKSLSGRWNYRRLLIGGNSLITIPSLPISPSLLLPSLRIG